jgi:hypothetical protein
MPRDGNGMAKPGTQWHFLCQYIYVHPPQISFIVQQMRRGFEDERLMRKRFSASLMGLRGVTSSNASLLNAAYGGGSGSERGSRLISGKSLPQILFPQLFFISFRMDEAVKSFENPI